MSEPRGAAPAWTMLMPGVFLLHALNYLYFFVDDEAIPFVFARHLLEGKGLVYNSFEGRVEGYSDFLQVLAGTAYLAAARVLHLGPVAVFFIGKAVSLASGTALVALVTAALRRNPLVTTPGLLLGAGFLASATPLARWSASSLEMAVVALLATILMLNVYDGSASRDRASAIAACLLVLLRIDGFVFVFALVAPAWLSATRDRRGQMVRNIIVPLAVTLGVYHAWRAWYFGHWLSTPLITKVLYKLHPVPNVVVRSGTESYLSAFVGLYGIIAAASVVGLMIVAVVRDSKTLRLLIAVALLVTYAAVVGDWMPGFRFFLPALPGIAVLIALGISTIADRRVAWVCAIVACLWLGATAVRAATQFDRFDYRESWWQHPSVTPARYFGPYMALYEALRPLAPKGTRISYNQAGFITYMLDADNIDDLGICSRFVAGLPTTDVVFTGAGRYSPLTNGPALRAANAYVLYRAPELVIAQLDILRSANGGGIPTRILRSHYERVETPPHLPAAIYRKVVDPAPEFQSSPHVFLENLAHPSRVRYAFDGAVIPSNEYASQLGFLEERSLDRTFSGNLRYQITFAAADEPVYELTIEGLWTRIATTLTLTLQTTGGAVVRQDTRLMAADQPARVRLIWPDGPRAAQLSIALQTAAEAETRLSLHDLRVQGQSPALEQYVRQLAFPPAPTH